MPEVATNLRPRVLFAIGGLGAGGSETQLCEIVARLHPKMIDAQVIVAKAEPGPRLDRLLGAGVPITELGYPPNRGLRFSLQVGGRYLRTLRAIRPEVVYVWLEETSLFVVPWCRLLRIPVVVARRNVSGARLEAHWPIGIAIRWAERRACLVTANSEAVMVAARSRGIASMRLRLIPNALPPQQEQPPPPTPPVRIGYLARMRPEKGHHRFLRTLRHLPDGLEWIALLGGDGMLEDALRDEVERLGLHRRVSFCGDISDAAAFWDGCHIAVLLSDHEGSPNSLIEAARAGRPLLATAVGGTPEVVREGAGFLVDLDDDRACARALAKLIRDPELRSDMGARSRRHALAAHDPAVAAALHLSVLNEALAR